MKTPPPAYLNSAPLVSRRLRWILIGGLLFIYGALVVRGLPSLLEKRRQIGVLQEQNAAVVRAIEDKKRHIERLKSNPAELNEDIRKQFNLHRPGEKTFTLPPDRTPPSPKRR